MSIKMIVTDLDGTLLRQDKTISEYTESVFRRCVEKGIKIVFATARPIRTVTSLNLNINNNAAIYHNGAVIAINGTVYKHIGIEPETTNQLLLDTTGRFTDLKISVEINDMLYANFDVKKVWGYDKAVFTDFSDLPVMPADKIIFVTVDRHIVDEINKMLTDDLYSLMSENILLMVMNKNARKRNAIQELLNHYQLNFSQVIAFGEDYNDVEMLRECGIGVAVANGIDEAKSVADAVCESNDNDGVAKWIERNVL